MNKPAIIGLLTLATTFTAFSASTNYQSLKVNDDGTSTVIGPRFKTATGKNAHLSSRSSKDGVCKLYGFDFMVGDSAVTSGDDTSKTAVIDGRGRYQTHYSYSNSGYKSVINSIVCSRDHAVLTVSTRTAASENDDGSYSLLYPKVGHYDKGRVSHISASSDLNGICTYHGLGNAVRGSLISAGDDSNRTVILGDNGNLVGFKEYSNRGYNKVVKAIVCEPGDGGVGTDRGDIDETVEISLRELRRMENEIKKLKQLVHQQRSEIGTLRTEKDTVKRQLELKIAELEQETKLNGKARKKLKGLKNN